MKLSLVLPASLLACAGSSSPPVVPLASMPEPSPVSTTSACAVASDRSEHAVHAEPAPVNVTVNAPAKVIDPKLAEVVKRLPPFEQTALVTAPASLKTIDGRLRLHGKNGYAQVEVSLPALTSQCEATLQSAIQMQRAIELKGKGRVVADQVPGHGYVSAWDLDDVTSCLAR